MGTKCGERKIYKNRMDTKFGERKMYRNCMDTKCQERKIYRNCMDRKYKERKIYIHTSRSQRFTEEGEETTWIQHAGERKITHTLRRQRDRMLILLKSLIHSPSCCSFSKCDRELTDYVVNPVYLQLLKNFTMEAAIKQHACGRNLRRERTLVWLLCSLQVFFFFKKLGIGLCIERSYRLISVSWLRTHRTQSPSSYSDLKP